MKIQQGLVSSVPTDLDATFFRHPIANDLLSFKVGLFWTIAWAFLTLIGAYTLNPICVLIFLIGCSLEVIYCLLLKVSYLRAIVSGVVKTSGGLAAVFAADPDPSFSFLLILFLLLFFWEIGGQNIPNDWADIAEDGRLKAQTIPVRFGPERASKFILVSLMVSVSMSGVLSGLAPVHYGSAFILACLSAGCYLLLFPAYRLGRTKEPAHALTLFNRASTYPLALLVIVSIKIMA